MSWYAGTAKVRNGSKTVIVVAGGGLVANSVLGGNGFLPVGSPLLEIDTVDGPNQLTLKRAWLGVDSDAVDFSIAPTNGAYLDLAAAAVKMLQPFQAVIDGIGQGLIPAGTAAAPGLRFLVDQDTGFRRPSENAIALVTGGVDRLTANADGSVGFGFRINLSSAQGVAPGILFGQSATASWLLQNIAGANAMALIDNQFGVTRQYWDGVGNVGFNTTAPTKKVDISTATDRDGLRIGFTSGPTGQNGGAITFAGYTNAAALVDMAQIQAVCTNGAGSNNYAADLIFRTSNAAVMAERMRLDSGGNLLVGAASGNNHTVTKTGLAEGGTVLQIDGGAGSAVTAQFKRVNASAYNGGAPAALMLGNNTSNNRSLTVSGTINANGGDTCEVFWKSLTCGTILKGDICGIDADGLLTRTWSEAVLFGFKTTNPHLVGRDKFHLKAGPEPEQPVYEAPVYEGPEQPQPVAELQITEPADIGPEPAAPVREDGETDDAFVMRMAASLVERMAWVQAASQRPALMQQIEMARATYAAATAAFQEQQAAFDAAWGAYQQQVTSAEIAHAEAMAAFATEHAAWQDRLTAAAKEVDRIATNGQIPVEFDGPFEPGQILVPVAKGAGIGLKAIDIDAATDAEWRRSVGRIIKRLGKDDPDTIETSEIWGRPAEGMPWVFVSALA